MVKGFLALGIRYSARVRFDSRGQHDDRACPEEFLMSAFPDLLCEMTQGRDVGKTSAND